MIYGLANALFDFISHLLRALLGAFSNSAKSLASASEQAHRHDHEQAARMNDDAKAQRVRDAARRLESNGLGGGPYFRIVHAELNIQAWAVDLEIVDATGTTNAWRAAMNIIPSQRSMRAPRLWLPAGLPCVQQHWRHCDRAPAAPRTALTSIEDVTGSRADGTSNSNLVLRVRLAWFKSP